MDKIREYRNLEANDAIEPQIMNDIKAQSGNIYRSLAVIAKRSNQIGIELKRELNQKLEEFAATTDTLEEVLENREQIEISKYYEKLPHSTLLATKEFLEGSLHFKPKDEAKDEA